MKAFILGCVLGIAMAAVLIVGAEQNRRHKENWFDQCQQDHKQYECEAIWRGGSLL